MVEKCLVWNKIYDGALQARPHSLYFTSFHEFKNNTEGSPKIFTDVRHSFYDHRKNRISSGWTRLRSDHPLSGDSGDSPEIVIT